MTSERRQLLQLRRTPRFDPDTSVERYPLDLEPASTTQVNVSRLPEPKHLAAMEMACREDPREADELYDEVWPDIRRFVFRLSLAAIGIHLIGAIVPLKTALIVAALIGVIGAVVDTIRTQEIRFGRILLWLFLSPLAAVLLSVGAWFLSFRPVAASLLLLSSLVAMFWVRGKAHPVYFYREWLFAAPQLKPETRLNRRNIIRRSVWEQAKRFVMALAACGIVFFLAVVVPALSPLLAIAGLIVFGFFLNDFRPWNTWRQLKPVLARHLAYGLNSSGAAGVWMPEADIRLRRRALIATLALFYAGLSTGLLLYFPADAIAISQQAERAADATLAKASRSPAPSKSTAARTPRTNPKPSASPLPGVIDERGVVKIPGNILEQKVYPDGTTEPVYSAASPTPAPAPTATPRPTPTPTPQWRTSAAVTRASEVIYDARRALAAGIGNTLTSRNFDTHAGLKELFSRMWRTKTINLEIFFLFFVLPLAFAFVIPPLLLLGLCRGLLTRCEELEEKIEGAEGIDKDERTEWQCYVDRVRESQHAVTDPLGIRVREAEHIFLGLEPTLKFPVLVDRRILSEHCYMVGQTGSGKTSLGIMPLLIQLIRGHNVAEAGEYRAVAIQLLDQFIEKGRTVLGKIRGQTSPAGLMTLGLRSRIRRLKKRIVSDEGETKPAKAIDDMLRYFFESEQPAAQDEVYDAARQHFRADLKAIQGRSIKNEETAEEALERLLLFAVKKRRDLDHDPFEAAKMVRRRKVPSPKVPVVIIDLKGDPALFHTARIEAQRRGQKFLYFTLEQGKSTYLFNPFQGFESEHRTLIQLCNLFLDALSLNHGDSYGRSYYSRQARMLLFDALGDEKQPRTFPDLFRVIKEMSGRDTYRDAYELLATIHALKQYPQLVTSQDQEVKKDDQHVIYMPRVIEEGQVVYFWLPAAIESISVREVGKLALFCLLSAAIDRQRENKEQKQIYLIIDEFQRIAGENLKIILEQARSFGLSAILANQTLSDLKMRDWDLRPTIRTNTRLQLYFSVTDPTEVKMLSEMSGEELIRSKSWTTSTGHAGWAWNRQRQHMHSHGWKEELKPRLTTNDIAQISDHPLEMIAFVSRGEGYTQFGGLPFPVLTTWPIPYQEYQKRRGELWPTDGQTISNPDRPPRERDKEARQRLRRDELREVIGKDIMSVIDEAKDES